MTEQIIKTIATALSGLLMILLYSIPFYFLWNYLIPEIFYLKNIDLFESYGLMLFMYLIKFLFSSKIDTTIK